MPTNALELLELSAVRRVWTMALVEVATTASTT